LPSNKKIIFFFREVEYNLPTEDLVKVDSDTDMHILDLALALPYASIPARVYNLKVVLPEGSVFAEVIFLGWSVIYVVE
jgi:hypothetical protein